MKDKTTPFQKKSALVVGQVTHDQYNGLVPGGCAYYAAKTIHALGGKTSLLSSVGLDFQFENELDGINRLFEIGAQTTTFLNVYPAIGPRMQYVENLAPTISKEMLPPTWRHPNLLILAPVMGEIDGHAWRSLRDAEHVSLFLQGFMKRANFSQRNHRRLVVPLETPFNFDILEKVDSVFLSEEDIELFASSSFIKELTKRVKIVAVTRGTSGSRIYFENTHVDFGIYKTDVVDPTGAGDTFGAAVAMALACGMSVVEAGQLGTAAASVVVEGQGGALLSRVGVAWERRSHVSSSCSKSPQHAPPLENLSCGL